MSNCNPVISMQYPLLAVLFSSCAKLICYGSVVRKLHPCFIQTHVCLSLTKHELCVPEKLVPGEYPEFINTIPPVNNHFEIAFTCI